MKKLFLFLLSVLFSGFIYSQNELALYGVWEGEIFKKNSHEFFCATPANIFIMDENIEMVGQSNAGWNSNNVYFEGAFLGRDSSVIISQIAHAGSLFPSLVKYDKEWNEVFDIFTNWSGRYGGELSDSTIIYGGHYNDGIFAVDPNGGELWSVGVGWELKDIHVTSGDSIISISNDGLFVFSDNGDTISIFPSFNFERIVPINNNGWIGQKKDSLFLLSPDFNLLETNVFPDVDVKDLEADYGKVVLLTKDSTIHIYDELLVFENNFKINSNNFPHPKNFELTEDGLIVSMGSAFKKFLWDGTDLYTENNDVGIVGVELGNYIVEDYIAVWYPGPNYDTIVRLRYTNPIFTVHNYGETIIESFDIRTSFPVIYVGYWNYYVPYNGSIRKNISNISIEPGEEKEVGLSNLDFYFYDLPDGEIYDQCFWTSQPNLRIDDDYSNDKYCFEMAVSTEEEFLDNLTVSIFPNPSNGNLKLSVGNIESKNASWIIFDQFGRQQFLMPLNNWQNEYDVSLHHLPTGIYFWKIQTRDGQLGSGKLLIQN